MKQSQPYFIYNFKPSLNWNCEVEPIEFRSFILKSSKATRFFLKKNSNLSYFKYFAVCTYKKNLYTKTSKPVTDNNRHVNK